LTLANKILDFKVVFLLVDLTTEQIATKILVSTLNQGIFTLNMIKQQSMVDYLAQLPVHQTNFPPPATGTLSQVFGISEMSQN
jgi:hypothetical protein